MNYALDTNTLIYLFKNLGNVGRHVLSVQPSQLAIPAIALYELEGGIALSTQPEKRRRQVDTLLQTIRILPFDEKAATRAASVYAELRKLGKPISVSDTLVAGTALATGTTLVTRNFREFQRVKGLQVVDWF